jgi:hypothetical protein
MSLYRTYYMNADGHFTGILELNFPDDDAAIADAESRVGDHYAIEVFKDGLRIGRIESVLAPV